MKIYLNENVWDAALERIRWLFDEFDNVVISNSGGKDSTITMNLALKVAEEKGRLPVKMVFVDQEAEYRMTIEYMRHIMADPRIEPIWLQCPIKLFNAASTVDPWLMCWEDGGQWMREREEISIKENVFGTERFHDIFPKILEYYYPDQKACYLAGVRAEESPARFAGLSTGATYKHITYGKRLNKKLGHYTFYPLYDWCLSDVWKAIHDNDWEYCKIYDELYRYGIPPKKMRVSNLHHETAVHSLFFLQEVEHDTWEALVARLGGINQAAHMSQQDVFTVKELPYMFESWEEFRDHLTENLITDEKHRELFRKKWAKMDDYFKIMENRDDLIKEQVKSVLLNDWEFIKIDNFLASPPMIVFLQLKRGQLNHRPRTEANMKYIPKQFWEGVEVI